MKKINFFILLIAVHAVCFAQKEYWGVTTENYYNSQFGTIYKTDSVGENPVIIHQFDSINGASPISSLFQASNGKLYGTTPYGGLNPTFGGTLFEYDLSIDSFKVVTNFNSPQNPLDPPVSSLIEVPQKGLFGETGLDAYKYNISSQLSSSIYHLPLIPNGIGSVYNQFSGNLMLGVNGKIYGTTLYNSTNTNSNPFMGSIFTIDTATSVFSVKYLFSPFNFADGKNPTGNLVQLANGKLYGSTYNGGISDTAINTGGVIFEFDPTTNMYSKKVDLNLTVGCFPYELIKGSNNKLYGLAGNGGTDAQGNHYGTLFEYDPATNIFTKKHDFGFQSVNFPAYLTGYQVNGYLLQSSNGKLYGSTNYGMFEYDYNTGNMRVTFTYANLNTSNPGRALIEICHKPSYKYFYTDSFTVCSGDPFNYTVHSKNAATYQWNKNGIAISLQTDSTLYLNNLMQSDSGMYSCILTNQCGQTETMNLIVKVDSCPIIPVRWLSPLTARLENGKAVLNWSQEKISDNEKIIVEYSYNGSDFIMLANVSVANGTDYRYTDENILNGTVYYRIKAVDANSRPVYSNIAYVNAKNLPFRVFPNPVIDVLYLTGNLKIKSINIYNAYGQMVLNKNNGEKVNVSLLSKGLYLLSVQTENGIIKSTFIKN